MLKQLLKHIPGVTTFYPTLDIKASYDMQITKLVLNELTINDAKTFMTN